VKFGVWTPLPHTVRHDEALTEAIVEARTLGANGPDKALGIAVDTLREAEALGFVTTLVAARHAGPDLDAWILASALAMQTRSIELIVAVHPGIFNPQMVAKMAASLDRISGGRAAINVVNGWWEDEFVNYGNGSWLPSSDDRYDRMSEFMQVLRGMWEAEEPYTYNGRFYSTRDAVLPLRPARVFPRIYAASSNPAGQDMIAAYGDMWFTLPGQPDAYLNFDPMIAGLAKQVEEVKARGLNYKRDIGAGVTAHVIACETDEEALAKAAELVEYGKQEFMNIVVATALGGGFVGSYETVARRLDAYEDAGFDLALLHFYPMIDGMRTLMEKVVPLMKSSGRRAA